MKKKQIIEGTPHLDRYKTYMELGYMGGHFGLCDVLLSIRYRIINNEYKPIDDYNRCHELHDLIKPTPEDGEELRNEGLDDIYWGSEAPWYKRDKKTFTPLRQTLLLFLAAMNNEL